MTNNFKAQEHFDQNLTDKSVKKIELANQKLTGDLIIQEFPQLEEVELPSNELTSLIIINCPELRKINARNNKLTELNLAKVKIDGQNNPLENEITEIIAGSNDLTELDLTTCQKIKKLIVPDNSALNIKKLNLTSITNLNISNTSVSLDENYQELKKDFEDLKTEKDALVQALKEYDNAGFQKKLVLTEAIQTLKQADEAILRLLVKTEKSWRTYYESKDPNIAENSPTLGAFFQFPEQKRKSKEILKWIIEAQTSGDYEELFKKWCGGDEYNAEYDFDDSLKELEQLLERKKKLEKQ